VLDGLDGLDGLDRAGSEGPEVRWMSDRFYGTFTPRLDDKSRLTLPHRYREAFKGGAVVVRGRSRCLYVFTSAGYDDFAEEAINAKVTDPVAIGQARYMLANSDEQVPDAQGRIILTARMREFAGLHRDVVLTGQGRRMEVWDAEHWAAYEAEQEAAYVDTQPPAGPDPLPRAAPPTPDPGATPGTPD
jgi:MraZ protein